MSPPGSPAPTGLPLVDHLSTLPDPHIEDYVAGASEYVRAHWDLAPGQAKAAQIRLSDALGRELLSQLRIRLPSMGPDAVAGEREVAGALRSARVDVSETHRLDGLRLAIELKPVNLSVGKAIWNRFGDIRMTAVNLHLKFPFAVVGGILAVPVYEETAPGVRRTTRHLIERAVARLERAGGRRTEADAPHLLEAVGVLVYDPDTALIETTLPPQDSPLTWDHFIDLMATAYLARFD